mmetsp:Transcript_9199/g.30362  ORF Transcript_9199/g.30362 Transcript_9199/m.30362 type:complete len:201 (-) Transcript_9199:272-874(-)
MYASPESELYLINTAPLGGSMGTPSRSMPWSLPRGSPSSDAHDFNVDKPSAASLAQTPSITRDARDASARVLCASAGLVHAVSASDVDSLRCVSSKRFNTTSASRVDGSEATSTPGLVNPMMAPPVVGDGALGAREREANGFSVDFSAPSAVKASALVNDDDGLASSGSVAARTGTRAPRASPRGRITGASAARTASIVV